MKRIMVATSVIMMAALLTCVSFSQAKAEPTITVLNLPTGGLLRLAVGESFTFDVEITSDEPFLLAMAMTDAYYPGRSIYCHGVDRATQATTALLHLTITGKNSTADLPEVCDWPEPGDCWPVEVAPVSIVAAVRYKGGLVIAQRFAFAVEVY